MKKVAAFMIEETVKNNFNDYEVGCFEGLLYGKGIKEFLCESFERKYIAYIFLADEETIETIDNICKEKDLHYKQGKVTIQLD